VYSKVNLVDKCPRINNKKDNEMKRLILMCVCMFGFLTVPCLAEGEVPEVPKVPEVKQETTIDAKGKMMNALVDFLVFSKESLKDGTVLVKDGIKESANFAKREIPLILKELIALRRIEVICGVLGTMLFVIVCYIIGGRIKKYIDKKNADDSWGREEEWFIFCYIAHYVLRYAIPIVTILIMSNHTRKSIKPFAAPRVYLIEYTVDLIKENKDK